MSKYLLALLLVLNLSCRNYRYVTDVDITNERISESEVSEDQSILSLISPYKSELDAEMNKVIGELSTELTKDRPESTLGNWLSDMLYDELTEVHHQKIDFVIQNQGGVRVNSISAGPILIGEVYEIMPFDNKITILKADANQVQTLLDHIAKSGGWPVSRHVNFAIENDKAIDIMVNEAPLNANVMYHIALPDYIANGGSGSHFLREYDRIDLDLFIRDIFIDHIKHDAEIGIIQSAQLDQRVLNK